MRALIEGIVKARLWLALASAGLLLALAAGPAMPAGGYLAVLAGVAVLVALWVAGIILLTVRARRRRNAEPR